MRESQHEELDGIVVGEKQLGKMIALVRSVREGVEDAAGGETSPLMREHRGVVGIRAVSVLRLISSIERTVAVSQRAASTRSQSLGRWEQDREDREDRGRGR